MSNEIVTKSYDIDISKTGARPIVRLSQYDTRSVRVLFTVYDGTELQAIDGCTARVDGKRSDGTAFSAPCDIEQGSKVGFTVESEMTNAYGMHEAELVIINSDGNPLGTQNFTIAVEKAPFERENAATVDDRTLFDQYTTAVDTRVTAAIKKADDAVTADTGKVDKLVSDTQARIDAIVSETVTPIERGGTGATTAAGARNALGLGNTTEALPVANGGTGATTAEGALTALGAQEALSPKNIASGTVNLLGATYDVDAIAYGKVVYLRAKHVSGSLTSPGKRVDRSDAPIRIPDGYRCADTAISGWVDSVHSVTLGFELQVGLVYLVCSSYGVLDNVVAVSFSATYIAE